MTKSTKRANREAFVDKNFDPRLKRMLHTLLIVAFIILVYVVYSAIKNEANPLYVILGLIAGVAIGLFFARMFKISWDTNAQQVVYRMDIIGLILLVFFIIFDFSRVDLVADVISGPSVKPTSFALLAGTFYGRVYGTGHTIVAVLRDQNILPKR